MRPYRSENPATGHLYGEYPVISDDELAGLVKRVDSGYRSWRAVNVDDRAAALAAGAGLFRERQGALAAVVTEEMGKTWREAKGEVALVASIFDFYAQRGAEMIAPRRFDPISGDEAQVRLDPIGAILGIMPWNYPYYQLARLAAPNLLLGNTILLKHARNCPRSALAFEEVLHEAGISDDAYINAFIDSSQIEAVISDPRIQGVSLTGSEQAGESVGRIAGAHVKKMVLELGGSDPFIVLDDADVDAAADAAVIGRMGNAGQACTASKRLIVVDEVYDEFLDALTARVERLAVGDPFDDSTDLGPLSTAQAVHDLHDLVDDAVRHGAEVVIGGRPLDGEGCFYTPTILTDVPPEARAFREELFGPVAVVYRVAGTEAAIDLANDSPYGLGGTIFTRDLSEGHALAEHLDVGMVTLNGSNKTQPDLPFGGVKRSGVGRELGTLGIEEFANRKLVRVPSAALVGP